eukprot:12135365-Alexandrium_andersonii.AAC.1
MVGSSNGCGVASVVRGSLETHESAGLPPGQLGRAPLRAYGPLPPTRLGDHRAILAALPPHWAPMASH